MTWAAVGSVSVGPTDREVVVGPLQVPPMGGIELKVRQTSPDRGFRFGYGVASFQARDGRPLGSVKFWAGPQWESFRLGAGLSSSYRVGSLVIQPRSYNLRWIKAGYSWGLEFRADQYTELPADRERGAFVSAADRLLRTIRVGTQARLLF